MVFWTHSEWYQLPTTLSEPLCKYSAVYDDSVNTLYIAGGNGYGSANSDSWSVKNSFYSLTFDLTSDQFDIGTMDDISDNYYTLYLGFIEQDLNVFRNDHSIDNGAGYYNDKLYLFSPEYYDDINTLYMLICDNGDSDNYNKCKLYDTTENELYINSTVASQNDGEFDLYWQPSIVQYNNLLYFIGGYYGYEVSNDILVFDMETESFDWSLSEYNILPMERAYHTSTLCNNNIYILGGYDDSSKYSNDIIKCEINSGNGKIVECNELDSIVLNNDVRDARSICINDQFIAIVGGEYSESEYSDQTQILDCLTDTLTDGPTLPYGLSSFQLISITNNNDGSTQSNTDELIYHICGFGGTTTDDNNDQIILDDINCFDFEITANDTTTDTDSSDDSDNRDAALSTSTPLILSTLNDDSNNMGSINGASNDTDANNTSAVLPSSDGLRLTMNCMVLITWIPWLWIIQQ